MSQNNPLYIVTGATGALGRATATALAIEGKPVILACQNLNEAAVLARELTAKTGNDDIAAMKLDLCSFASVRSFVDELKKLDRPVHALIHNAGVMTRSSQITADGFEQVVQVNYLGPALLSILTAPIIEIGGKIVFTTSLTRMISRVSNQFPHEPDFSQIRTYGRSKFALTMFSIYLTTVLKTSGVLVECADPGLVNAGLLKVNRWVDRMAEAIFSPITNTPEEGAEIVLRALNATESGNLYNGDSEKRLVSTLKDKDMFVTLLNNTLRILNKEKK